eukprot:121999-Amorphochlora_amoeboformis.AAC.1
MRGKGCGGEQDWLEVLVPLRRMIGTRFIARGIDIPSDGKGKGGAFQIYQNPLVPVTMYRNTGI